MVNEPREIETQKTRNIVYGIMLNEALAPETDVDETGFIALLFPHPEIK